MVLTVVSQPDFFKIRNAARESGVARRDRPGDAAEADRPSGRRDGMVA
jgi:hypothetical protein